MSYHLRIPFSFYFCIKVAFLRLLIQKTETLLLSRPFYFHKMNHLLSAVQIIQRNIFKILAYTGHLACTYVCYVCIEQIHIQLYTSIKFTYY